MRVILILNGNRLIKLKPFGAFFILKEWGLTPFFLHMTLQNPQTRMNGTTI